MVFAKAIHDEHRFASTMGLFPAQHHPARFHWSRRLVPLRRFGAGGQTVQLKRGKCGIQARRRRSKSDTFARRSHDNF